MKAADVSAATCNLTLRHKSSGKVYRTILNQQGYSWMQVRHGKLVVNARQYRNGQPCGPMPYRPRALCGGHPALAGGRPLDSS
jgi:hypothetical protein